MKKSVRIMFGSIGIVGKYRKIALRIDQHIYCLLYTSEITKGLEIVYVKTMDEVIKEAFV